MTSQSTRQLTNGSDMQQLLEGLHRKSYNDKEDVEKVARNIKNLKRRHEKASIVTIDSLKHFQEILVYHEKAYACAREAYFKKYGDQIKYFDELESINTGKEFTEKVADCDKFRWTGEEGMSSSSNTDSADDVNKIKSFFASWNVDIKKTHVFPEFKSVWMNTGFCPIIGNDNPCTGSKVVQAEVNYAIQPPQYCVLRGKETEEEIALLTGGSEQELDDGEEENDFENTTD